MNIVKLNDLRHQQVGIVQSITDTLKTVELNVTELCNRTCGFCPRADPTIYANKKSKMLLTTISKIVADLDRINFSNRISFVGFGEPLLYKDILDAVRIVKQGLPNLIWLEINTNGDFLTNELLVELINAGCNQLTVSMYDSDISNHIIDMARPHTINLTFKHCYPNQFNLQLVNRTDILTKKELLNINNPCYVPFYKMFIDWNGDALVCNNDWGRTGIVGNVIDAGLLDIWLGDSMLNYRKQLQYNRTNISPCQYCNINGTILGEDSFNMLINE
jgi:MoaA/NifB/PqqE/SkfB family radical SAM enzyme